MVGSLGQVLLRPWRMVTFWPEGNEPMADEQWKPGGVDRMSKAC